MTLAFVLTTDSSTQLSEPAFRVIRFLVATPILIVLALAIRRALVVFLGVQGRELGRRKYLYLGANLLVLAILELVRGPVERQLAWAGDELGRLLPYFEHGWLTAGLLGLYHTLIVSLLLLALFQLVGLLYWFIEDRIDRMHAPTTPRKAAARTLALRSVRLANRILRASLLIIVFAVYVPHLFRAFPRTRIIVDSLLSTVESPFRDQAQAVANYLPNLGYLLVIALFAWVSLMGLKNFFKAIEAGTLVFENFPPDWAEPTYKLCRFLLLFFVLMVSYPYLPGANSAFFRGFSLFAGALVTLGSAGAIGNIVAGVVTTYTGAFRVGDIVRIGDTFGKVSAKTLLSTRLRTPRNEEVTFPNGSVLSGAVVNYSKHARTGGLALSVSAGIGYDVDWRTIHRLMIEGARRTEYILSEPAPRVLEMSFDNYSVTYELRAWIDQPERIVEIYADLRRNVLDAFNEAGVEIMTPSILGHRDASDLAIPVDRFSQQGKPAGIAVAVDTTANPAAKSSKTA